MHLSLPAVCSKGSGNLYKTIPMYGQVYKAMMVICTVTRWDSEQPPLTEDNLGVEWSMILHLRKGWTNQKGLMFTRWNFEK